MGSVFGDPVQHRESGDEVPFVKQRGVLSEQGEDLSPGPHRRVHHPGVLPGLQRNRSVLTGSDRKRHQTEEMIFHAATMISCER